MKSLTIIGGGPAALMLAAQIDTTKYQVTICEKKKSVGRKFLVAGEGGLNLTYNSPIEEFIAQYSPSAFMDPIIRQFMNEDLIKWLTKLEIPTFIGSSNRVFPTIELKPIEVLNKIVNFVSTRGIAYKLDTKWLGWNKQGDLCFEDSEPIKSDLVVFALGGASWKVTGSDGAWGKVFADRGIKINPFKAANCAFSVDWNENFIATHEGKPLKNITLTFNSTCSKGELNLTEFGIEGNAVYALSQKIQEKLLSEESVVIYLDLKPTLTIDQLRGKYNNSQQTKVTDVLKQDLNLDRSSIGIIKHFSDKESFLNTELLLKTIKAVPITINSSTELDQAISTLGGIDLEEIDTHFKFKKIPNCYSIGEMLDWYAPTGGYLLQGCFSMGFVLAKHLNDMKFKEE